MLLISTAQWRRYELLNGYLVPHISIYSQPHLFISVSAPPPPFLIQIETIGDAYCVAGGLHKKVDSHAKPIAHMALKMMELSEEVLTPDGKPIKVSFHSLSAMRVSEAILEHLRESALTLLR